MSLLETTIDDKEQDHDALDDPSFRQSFMSLNFETKDTRGVVKGFSDYDDPARRQIKNINYRTDEVYPSWMTNSSSWIRADAHAHNEISEILERPKKDRSDKQWSTLVQWIMSVWKIAAELGPKRCLNMTKAFHFFHYESGTDIVTEGDRGLTFYIIIDGIADVIKEGVGVVASLGKGKSFGEIALTMGNDLRTATVRAQSKVQTLSLHKSDYDLFVKDIQQLERRENFQILRKCELFAAWPRAKIEKMANTSSRRNFPRGREIFRQGDRADHMYIVIDGEVQIVKEVIITSRNRWPEGMNSWGGKARRTVKKIAVDSVIKGGFFGELAILKDSGRHATALCVQATQLLCLGKLEFLHIIQSIDAREMMPGMTDYNNDDAIMKMFKHVAGGPSSTIETYDSKMTNRSLDKKAKKERKLAREKLLVEDSMVPSTSPAASLIDRDSYDTETLGYRNGNGNNESTSNQSAFFNRLRTQLDADAAEREPESDVKHQHITLNALNAMDTETEKMEATMRQSMLHKSDLQKDDPMVSMRSPHGRRMSPSLVTKLRSDLHKVHNHQIEAYAKNKEIRNERNSRKTRQNPMVSNNHDHSHHLGVVPKRKDNTKLRRKSSFELHHEDMQNHKKRVVRRQKSTTLSGLIEREKTSGMKLNLSIASHHLEPHRSHVVGPETANERRPRQMAHEIQEPLPDIIYHDFHHEDQQHQQETKIDHEDQQHQQETKIEKENNVLNPYPEWIHNEYDELEEKEIKELTAEQLADMYGSYTYGKNRHELMLENLDFDPKHMVGLDADDYTSEEIVNHHKTMLHSMDSIISNKDMIGAKPGEQLLDEEETNYDIDTFPHAWKGNAATYTQHRRDMKKPKPNLIIVNKARLTYKDVLGGDR
jgi:CRP-like cAMP-binding protein